MHIPSPDLVVEEMRPLLLVVRAAVVHGIHKAREYFDTEGEKPDRDLAPELVRYHAKRYLDNAGHAVHELDEDYERPAVNKNGLRVLWKQFRVLIRKSDDGVLPVPGSATLIDFYAHNATYDFMTLEGPAVHVVVLWDSDLAYADLISLELVLPRSGGAKRELTSAFWYAPILQLAASSSDVDEEDLALELEDEDAHETGDE